MAKPTDKMLDDLFENLRAIKDAEKAKIGLQGAGKFQAIEAHQKLQQYIASQKKATETSEKIEHWEQILAERLKLRTARLTSTEANLRSNLAGLSGQKTALKTNINAKKDRIAAAQADLTNITKRLQMESQPKATAEAAAVSGDATALQGPASGAEGDIPNAPPPDAPPMDIPDAPPPDAPPMAPSPDAPPLNAPNAQGSKSASGTKHAAADDDDDELTAADEDDEEEEQVKQNPNRPQGWMPDLLIASLAARREMQEGKTSATPIKHQVGIKNSNEEYSKFLNLSEAKKALALSGVGDTIEVSNADGKIKIEIKGKGMEISVLRQIAEALEKQINDELESLKKQLDDSRVQELLKGDLEKMEPNSGEGQIIGFLNARIKALNGNISELITLAKDIKKEKSLQDRIDQAKIAEAKAESEVKILKEQDTNLGTFVDQVERDRAVIQTKLQTYEEQRNIVLAADKPEEVTSGPSALLAGFKKPQLKRTVTPNTAPGVAKTQEPSSAQLDRILANLQGTLSGVGGGDAAAAGKDKSVIKLLTEITGDKVPKTIEHKMIKEYLVQKGIWDKIPNPLTTDALKTFYNDVAHKGVIIQAYDKVTEDLEKVETEERALKTDKKSISDIIGQLKQYQNSQFFEDSLLSKSGPLRDLLNDKDGKHWEEYVKTISLTEDELITFASGKDNKHPKMVERDTFLNGLKELDLKLKQEIAEREILLKIITDPMEQHHKTVVGELKLNKLKSKYLNEYLTKVKDKSGEYLKREKARFFDTFSLDELRTLKKTYVKSVSDLKEKEEAHDIIFSIINQQEKYKTSPHFLKVKEELSRVKIPDNINAINFINFYEQLSVDDRNKIIEAYKEGVKAEIDAAKATVNSADVLKEAGLAEIDSTKSAVTDAIKDSKKIDEMIVQALANAEIEAKEKKAEQENKAQQDKQADTKAAASEKVEGSNTPEGAAPDPAALAPPPPAPPGAPEKPPQTIAAQPDTPPPAIPIASQPSAPAAATAVATPVSPDVAREEPAFPEPVEIPPEELDELIARGTPVPKSSQGAKPLLQTETEDVKPIAGQPSAPAAAASVVDTRVTVPIAATAREPAREPTAASVIPEPATKPPVPQPAAAKDTIVLPVKGTTGVRPHLTPQASDEGSTRGTAVGAGELAPVLDTSTQSAPLPHPSAPAVPPTPAISGATPSSSTPQVVGPPSSTQSVTPGTAADINTTAPVSATASALSSSPPAPTPPAPVMSVIKKSVSAPQPLTAPLPPVPVVTGRPDEETKVDLEADNVAIPLPTGQDLKRAADPVTPGVGTTGVRPHLTPPSPISSQPVQPTQGPQPSVTADGVKATSSTAGGGTVASSKPATTASSSNPTEPKTTVATPQAQVKVPTPGAATSASTTITPKPAIPSQPQAAPGPSTTPATAATPPPRPSSSTTSTPNVSVPKPTAAATTNTSAATEQGKAIPPEKEADIPIPKRQARRRNERTALRPDQFKAPSPSESSSSGLETTSSAPAVAASPAVPAAPAPAATPVKPAAVNVVTGRVDPPVQNIPVTLSSANPAVQNTILPPKAEDNTATAETKNREEAARQATAAAQDQNANVFKPAQGPAQPATKAPGPPTLTGNAAGTLDLAKSFAALNAPGPNSSDITTNPNSSATASAASASATATPSYNAQRTGNVMATATGANITPLALEQSFKEIRQNIGKESLFKDTKAILETNPEPKSTDFTLKMNYGDKEDRITRTATFSEDKKTMAMRVSLSRNAQDKSFQLFCKINGSLGPLNMKPCNDPEIALKILEASIREGRPEIKLNQSDITLINNDPKFKPLYDFLNELKNPDNKVGREQYAKMMDTRKLGEPWQQGPTPTPNGNLTFEGTTPPATSPPKLTGNKL